MVESVSTQTVPSDLRLQEKPEHSPIRQGMSGEHTNANTYDEGAAQRSIEKQSDMQREALTNQARKLDKETDEAINSADASAKKTNQLNEEALDTIKLAPDL